MAQSSIKIIQYQDPATVTTPQICRATLPCESLADVWQPATVVSEASQVTRSIDFILG